MKSKIKYYYDNGLWTDSMVRDAVRKNKITIAEYEEITGKKY